MFIFNTLNNSKDLLIPIKFNTLKTYVCGITVYDYCHLGHGRNMFIFYLINKYFKSRGYKIKYVRNITDIDKKIIKKSIKNKESMKKLTKRIINSICKDEKQLGLLSPDYEPKVSNYKNSIIYYIKKLIKKDFAYIINGNVYFNINKHKIYGMLSNQTIKFLDLFLSKKDNKYKKNKLDFSLWKKLTTPTQFKYSWDSPWSVGLPGWHIECSVLSKIYLGNKFDIHGGGLDLIFPHHENEKAQSELIFCKPHVNIWMHSGHLNINDKKMSKSLNNIIILRSILNQYHNEVIKYFFLLTHYRKSINFTKNQLDIAFNSLKIFYKTINFITPIKRKEKNNNLFYNKLILALENDFNTVKAISILFEIMYKIKNIFDLGKIKPAQDLCFELIRLGKLLGLLNYVPTKFLKTNICFNIKQKQLETLFLIRNISKKENFFLQSDKLRTSLFTFDVFLPDFYKRNLWYSSL
ncbi:Cysteine--tRNA ligase [Candidatus Portiera aleyrodidarum]|uniref:Cysteine--tRNA ligase n=1 Tax=Candidatus Portiera aleyrodidarum TaxID=91844 RepID=A0A6S6RTF9_9GAMM|nr:cysteine--tRNA ligase [Candidatus Portiera aleyrodidarum]CAA3707090.1 Cysteine--tRNA ligase [Candidatus Portiera aleyrodidarum]